MVKKPGRRPIKGRAILREKSPRKTAAPRPRGSAASRLAALAQTPEECSDLQPSPRGEPADANDPRTPVQRPSSGRHGGNRGSQS
jgi:hypothetical protein